MTKKYFYIHTLNGEPARYDIPEGRICHTNGRFKMVQQPISLYQIQKERRRSVKFYKIRHDILYKYPAESPMMRHGHIRIEYHDGRTAGKEYW